LFYIDEFCLKKLRDIIFPNFLGKSAYIQQPKQKLNIDSNAAHIIKIPSTILPANRKLKANRMVVTTEKITPILAAKIFGALSTIFFGIFKTETTPLAKVAIGLYLGLINPLIIKSIASSPVIIEAIRVEANIEISNATTDINKTNPATNLTVLLSLCSPEIGQEKSIAIMKPP